MGAPIAEALPLARRTPGNAGAAAPRWSPRRFQEAWERAKSREPKVRAMDLAVAADVTPATLYSWRAGNSEPNVNQAFALAAVLRVGIEDLLE